MLSLLMPGKQRRIQAVQAQVVDRIINSREKKWSNT
jgi:hypothetical protein